MTLSADGAWLVGMAFLDALEALPDRPGAVGGLTHGADPIVSSMVALSYVRECPIEGFYVRKEEKRHGTKRRIENPPEPGTKVVIVDDVVTSGGSLLKAVEQARAAGCEVVAALALVDRQEQDGAANVRKEVARPTSRSSRGATFRVPPAPSDSSRASVASGQPSSQEGSTVDRLRCIAGGLSAANIRVALSEGASINR